MAKVVKRTFSLTEEQARFIDAKVEAGDSVRFLLGPGESPDHVQ